MPRKEIGEIWEIHGEVLLCNLSKVPSSPRIFFPRGLRPEGFASAAEMRAREKPAFGGWDESCVFFFFFLTMGGLLHAEG